MSNYLSKKGLKDLEKELLTLNETKIPQILDAVNKAIAEGDLSENASLDSAKEEHDKLMGRKNEIEEVLANYIIIEEKSLASSTTVRIGSKVKITFLDTNRNFNLHIVGSSEADALDDKISNESPLAQAIIGKSVNQEISFNQNKQTYKVKILEIS